MPPVWSLPKRVAFRFGFIAGLLYLYPAPFGLIPKTDWLAEKLQTPWNWLVDWFAGSVLGADVPAREPTGSGDTLVAYVGLLVVVLLAAIGAAVWSALDRRRLAYPRLAAASWIGLRYFLSLTLLGYGFAKLMGGQFQPVDAMHLDERVGEMSPMGMLWTFQGASMPYTYFAGVAEIVPAILLLWRRTATLGAVIAMAVMTNVVMLNLCYDVPVKLFASLLLLAAALIAMPQLHRLLRAVLGGAVAEVPPRVRSSARVERLRLLAKIGMLVFVGWTLYSMHEQASEFTRPPSELAGLWRVDTFRKDGVEHPPLMTDAERWCTVGFAEWYVSVRACNNTHLMVQTEVVPAAQLIVLGLEEAELLRYTRRGDHLEIDGFHRGKSLHVALTREPPALLVSRGFHWIQEFPFNR